MNTSTRAAFADADQAHASTAIAPLLRPSGLVLPQTTTNHHCQIISNEYQKALIWKNARLPVTTQLRTDAKAWLEAELSFITNLGYWPVFVPRESLLSETLAAFYHPNPIGELTAIPITSLYNDDIHPVWSPLGNLLFRFVHDYHHYLIGADSTFDGELAVTRHILTPEVRKNDSLARFLASEPVGQSALFITSGTYPKQVIARNILDLI